MDGLKLLQIDASKGLNSYQFLEFGQIQPLLYKGQLWGSYGVSYGEDQARLRHFHWRNEGMESSMY